MWVALIGVVQGLVSQGKASEEAKAAAINAAAAEQQRVYYMGAGLAAVGLLAVFLKRR